MSQPIRARRVRYVCYQSIASAWICHSNLGCCGNIWRGEVVVSNVVELDSARPHTAAIVTCEWCSYAWVACYPIGVTYLECPACAAMTAREIAHKGEEG